MALAVISRQPYSEVAQMEDRQLDTLESIVRDLNDTKKGKRRGRPRR